MGLNQYADWTDEEIEAHLQASPASKPEPVETEVVKQSSGEIPKGVAKTKTDWSNYVDSRADMDMTKVGTVAKTCTAGWAFAAITQMEISFGIDWDLEYIDKTQTTSWKFYTGLTTITASTKKYLKMSRQQLLDCAKGMGGYTKDNVAMPTTTLGCSATTMGNPANAF